MKDKGLVSIDPKHNFGGPVAIIMENEDHFLGAYTVGMDFVGFKVFPKSFIGTTVWGRMYPASKLLLDLLSKIELVDTDLLTSVPIGVREKPVKPIVEEAISERRTTIVEEETEEKFLKLSERVKILSSEEEVKVSISLQTNSGKEIQGIVDQLRGLDPKLVYWPSVKKIVATLTVSEIKLIANKPWVFWIDLDNTDSKAERLSELLDQRPIIKQNLAIEGIEEEEEEVEVSSPNPNHSMIVGSKSVNPEVLKVKQQLKETWEKFEQLHH